MILLLDYTNILLLQGLFNIRDFIICYELRNFIIKCLEMIL